MQDAGKMSKQSVHNTTFQRKLACVSNAVRLLAAQAAGHIKAAPSNTRTTNTNPSVSPLLSTRTWPSGSNTTIQALSASPQRLLSWK